jgi:pilus assembly protein Flp/PilA
MLYLSRDQQGQGLTEYALILMLVAMVVLVILTVLGPQVANLFSRVTNGVAGT